MTYIRSGFESIIEFFQTIIDIFKNIYLLIEHFFKNLFYLFDLLPDIYDFLSNIILEMPSWLKFFASFSLMIFALYLMVGREHS